MTTDKCNNLGIICNIWEKKEKLSPLLGSYIINFLDAQQSYSSGNICAYIGNNAQEKQRDMRSSRGWKGDRGQGEDH